MSVFVFEETKFGEIFNFTSGLCVPFNITNVYPLHRTYNFYYWTKKFSTQEEESTEGKAFKLLDTVPSFGRNGRVIAHIHYPSGVSLELYEEVSTGFLKTLIG